MVLGCGPVGLLAQKWAAYMGAGRVIAAADIITHRLSLSEGKKAYELFDQKLDGCIKVILKP